MGAHDVGRPLAGKRVLVTRARAQAGELAARLRAAGAEPVLCPTIQIVPPDDPSALDAALRNIADYAWIVFTSANTVEQVEVRLQALGSGWSTLARTRVAAVGPRTAQALQERGVNVSFVPDQATAAALAAALPVRPGERVLWPHADLADRTPLEQLSARGAPVHAPVAYRTVVPEQEAGTVRALLASGAVDCVTFASASAVRNLYTLLGEEAARLLSGVIIACIGPLTAQAVRALGLAPHVVASEPTMDGLVDALEDYLVTAAHGPERSALRTDESERLFREAQRYIPGGVDSPVRAFKAVGGTPRFIERAAGPYLYDADGNRYIDYVGSYGPLIAGHAHPRLVAALQEALPRGTSFGAPTRLETELARRICAAMPSIELVRFVSSGTEATMSALRVARAYTGRDVIVKVEGGYHGHADSLLARAGSGATTLGVPDSPGVPAAVAAGTINIPFGNAAALEEALRTHEVAAFIVEPVPANMGVVVPAPGYLGEVRRLTRQYGALLIFDEVITGFRLSYGGAQGLYGIEPDLTCLGKIIGGGLPVGAYGGRRAVMELVAPSGPVYQAGTLSGNPLAMAAGIAMLDLLAGPGVYEHLEQTGTRLFEGLSASARKHGISHTLNHIGSIGTLFFTPGTVTSYAAARASDTSAYARFFHAMLDRGVYLAPAQFEAIFVSLAHGDEEIAATIAAADAAWAAMAERG